MGDAWVQIVLIAVLIVLNGWFAAAEIALISARRAALQQKADESRSPGAATALELTEDPTRLLATTQVGITVVGFLASATAAVSLAKPVEAWLKGFGIGWLTAVAAGLAVFLVTLLISYVTLVLGELVPKRLGLQRAEAVASSVARPISIMETVAAPLVWVLTKSTDVVALAFGIKPGQGREGVSEEEIKLLVTEQGTLLDEEKRMIHEIFELGDTVAREVMVPRVDMVLVEDTETVSDALAVLRGSGYSRLPVFHQDRDKIVGVLLLKDILQPVDQGESGKCVTTFMREPVFVPETKGILPLLSEMQARREQMVIAVDEYGGTAGLVTLEDIVEEIVGEIADEFDRDQNYITEIRPREWVIDGRLPIEDAIELGLPVDESDEYDTLAGWLLSRLGHIPATGEIFAYHGCSFRVQAMRRRRVSRLRVTCEAPAQTETEDDDD